MTEKENQEKKSLGKREKILVSAVVIASILGVVGGAALGVTVLSSNPQETVPGTAPTTTPMAPLAGTAGDTSVSGISVEDIEYRGSYDHTQDEPDWAEPNGFGIYASGVYSVEVTAVGGNGGTIGSVGLNPKMYLTYTEDGTMGVYEPDGKTDELNFSGTDRLTVDVRRATEADPSLDIDLDGFGGKEVWLGGTANEPNYLVSE